jgi:hypothetical protein
MSRGRRTIPQAETYRFSETHTLSDYPLLIGEILRRNRLRSLQEARLQALFNKIRSTLGVRVWQRLGPGNRWNGTGSG